MFDYVIGSEFFFEIKAVSLLGALILDDLRISHSRISGRATSIGDNPLLLLKISTELR